MKEKRNDVFRSWKFSAMLSKITKQSGAKAVKRECEDSTLDKVWGLKPVYTGLVLRRKAHAC